ncbi:protein FAM177A1 [Toxotes jaculatrix]|uniref:protein FAM177A1 n=1 Tax=Toxotes jaculatrix TaxID=941984 RepID=UPI001B3A8E99|nr:protein FAM177A1 [Toxotes jaculatrix]
MNNSHQEAANAQETSFAGPSPSKQKKVIYFSSGETLEEEDSEEEEEQSSNRPPFREPTERTRFSFKNVAILVGRISLMTCDFLGERLAGALGLNVAKYQYAIDQHQRDHKKTSSPATDGLMEGQAETIHLSPGLDWRRYGASGDARCPTDPPESYDEKHMNRKGGYHNTSYQTDEDYLK